jgi:hypothetical protein
VQASGLGRCTALLLGVLEPGGSLWEQLFRASSRLSKGDGSRLPIWCIPGGVLDLLIAEGGIAHAQDTKLGGHAGGMRPVCISVSGGDDDPAIRSVYSEPAVETS